MGFIKNVVKKMLQLDDKTGVSSLDDLIYVGSQYHGYWIPDNFLNERSVCYCAGAGNDISFDTELKTRFGSTVFIFDPSQQHKSDLKESPVDSIQNFMKEFGHSSVDLLQLNVADAAFTIIDTIVNNAVDVKMIVVEFDDLQRSDTSHLFKIRKSCNRLKKAGYVLVHSTKNLNRTFIRRDVYTRLFF